MKKIGCFIVTVFALLFTNTNNVAALTIRATVDGVTNQVEGLTKEVRGGSRIYVNLDDFCAKFSHVCKYTGKDKGGPITRTIKDLSGNSLYDIKITDTPWETTATNVIGIVNFNRNSFKITRNSLESKAFKEGGKAFVPIRFFAEALGCYISGVSGSFIIDSDYYRKNQLKKGYTLTFQSGSYVVNTPIPTSAKVMSVLLDKQYATYSRNSGWSITVPGNTVKYTWNNLKGYFYLSPTDQFSYTTIFYTDKSDFPAWIRVNVFYI